MPTVPGPRLADNAKRPNAPPWNIDITEMLVYDHLHSKRSATLTPPRPHFARINAMTGLARQT
jgi:hypothetical protein